MRRSLLRAGSRGFLLFGIFGIFVIAVYISTLAPNIKYAYRGKTTHIAEVLAKSPHEQRAADLEGIQQHFMEPMRYVRIAQASELAGRALAPGEFITVRDVGMSRNLIRVVDDGRGAVVLGPVNPMFPEGHMPVGLFLLLIGIPLVSFFMAERIARELLKIERANEALARGQFSARVQNDQGPSAELAASFNSMAERIEQLVRGRDELVQAVSHELGSPLARLRFHVEFLGGEPDRGKRRERLEQMTDELDELDELVSELLGYVQSDDVEVDAHRFNAATTLGHLLELVELEVGFDKHLELSLEVPDEAWVCADPRLFQRAVENILRNAARHAKARVRLRFEQVEQGARVLVEDDGPGIDEALREKVLRPFVRLESDRARKTGGVGLGLAIVHRIMHRHGGCIVLGTSGLGGASVALDWPP